MIKKKNLLSSILFNPKTIALFGLVIVILISFPLAKNMSRRRKINNEIKELKKEIELIENKNTGLQALIKYLNSEQFVEEQARLNFGLKKPGEEVAVIDANGGDVSDGHGSASKFIAGSEDVNEIKAANNPIRWWRYFFK